MAEVKQKILFIITQSEMGGAQRFVATAGLWLSQNGYEVKIASGGNEKIGSFQPESLKHLKRSPNSFVGILAIKEIYQLIKKEKPDTLFLCSTSAGVLGSIASRIYTNTDTNTTNKKVKVIYRIGGWAFNDPRPFWQKKLIIWIERFTSRFKDKIIINSQYDLETALKYKIAQREKLIKIYNGINLNEVNFLAKTEAQKYLLQNSNLAIEQFNNLKFIGVIANFYKTKGINCLIEAIKNFQFSIFNFQTKFVIIGDGTERPKIEKLIAKYNLQNKVILAGRIENASKYLKAFDIFVLPSLKEGFPWAILEAMVARLPIITTTVGAIPEILENEKSALLVPPNHPTELAKKIQDLLENPEKAKTLAQNAHSLLPNFTTQSMMQQIEQQLKA